MTRKSCATVICRSSLKRSTKKPTDTIRWGVYLLRNKAERIGSVDARDQEAAKARALKTMPIEPRERFRVSVQREH
jgi:hypothetical protein